MASKLHPKDTLTKRENRVALLLARGLHNREIADKLSKSPRTIEGFRSRIFEKLNVKSSVLMINKMLQLDLIEYENGKFRFVKPE